MAKRLNVVHGSQSLGSSALISRSLLRIWNQRLLQRPFSYCETSQCCPWEEKPRIIGTDLKVCFESETKGFRGNHFCIVERLNFVHDSQSIEALVLIWRNLLRIWNQRFLQQPFSCGETSQGCQWQPKPRIICDDLKRSASNQKPKVSSATIFIL